MLKKKKIFIKFTMVCLLLCGGCSWYFQMMLMEKIYARATDPALAPEAREHAVKELVALGEPAARFLLFRIAAGTVPDAVQAGEILGRIGDAATAPIRQALPSLDGRKLVAVLEALGHAGGDEAGKILIPYTAHEDWRVRRSALISLNRAGEKIEAEIFLNAAADVCPFVRMEAVAFFRDHPSADGEAILLACLDDESYMVRFNAASALSAYSDTITPRIGDIQQSLSSRGKMAFIETLKQFPARTSGPRLRALLADPDWAVRGYAALALGESAGKEAMPFLEEQLREESHLFARERIIEALAMCGEEGQSRQTERRK